MLLNKESGAQILNYVKLDAVIISINSQWHVKNDSAVIVCIFWEWISSHFLSLVMMFQDGVWWFERANWVGLAHWESVVFSLARHKSWSIWTCSEWSWCVCWPALWPQTWQGCSRNFHNENKVKWDCCSFDMKFSLNPFNLKQTH